MKYPADKPCPRPGEMIVVKTKLGSFWRMKRAKGTPINDGMKGANTMLKMLSPAAARFVGELRPYMLNMEPGMINLRVKSCLHRSVKEKGRLEYEYMEELDFQPQYPTWKLMKPIPGLMNDGNDVVLHIAIPEGGAVKALNTYISGYRFSLMMIVGDVVKGDLLQTFAVSSPRYKTGIAVEEGCELRMVRPDEGEKWICIFSIVSYQGKSLPLNGRHYAMEVVGWDGRQMLEKSKASLEVEGTTNRKKVETAGVGLETAGVNEVASGLNGKTAGVNNKTAGINGRTAGVNDKTAGVNSETAGVNNVISDSVSKAIEQAIDRSRMDLRENIRRVAMVILRAPGLKLPEIASKANMPVRSLERHVKYLKDSGLVEYRGSAKKGGYFLCGE